MSGQKTLADYVKAHLAAAEAAWQATIVCIRAWRALFPRSRRLRRAEFLARARHPLVELEREAIAAALKDHPLPDHEREAVEQLFSDRSDV
jgi:hypothetical protein